MPLKNIVRAFALMFAIALSASACDPPDAADKPQQRGAESGERTPVTTELHKAASSNPSPAVLEVLLKAGADVNAKDADGWTPLHAAAEKNPSPAVLEVLLKAGADPRAIDKKGKTPHAVAKPEYRDILWKAMMDKPLK
jgi:ankyrin repeat protein